MRALLKGYNGALPQGKYPVAALFVKTDPALIDVNIHPRKEEIKFVHEHKIEQMVQQAVKNCLVDVLAQQLSTPQKLFIQSSADFTTPTAFAREIQKNQYISSQHTNIPSSQHTNIPAPIFTPGRVVGEHELFSEPTTSVTSAVQMRSYKFIGQCYQTYLVLEKNDELIFIDQHAAHERILYERLINKKVEIQPVALLFPHTVTLAPQALELLNRHGSLFARHGIVGDCM